MSIFNYYKLIIIFTIEVKGNNISLFQSAFGLPSIETFTY